MKDPADRQFVFAIFGTLLVFFGDWLADLDPSSITVLGIIVTAYLGGNAGIKMTSNVSAKTSRKVR